MDPYQPLFTVGDAVRYLRQGKGWGVRQLAALSGTSRATVSAIERNRSQGQHDTLLKIANAFGKTLPELEAMVGAPAAPLPLRRAADHDLPAEYVALARRIMRLTPSAFTCLLVLIGHFEMEMSAHRDEADGPLMTHATAPLHPQPEAVLR
jgi:transcriptional regulator with XRE-family HTH domain